MKTLTHKQSVLAAAWLAAFEHGECMLDFAKPSQARYAMQQLYKLAKLLREHPLLDPKTLAAANNCSMSQQGAQLRIYSRALSGTLGAMHKQLVEDPAEASLQRLMEKSAAAEEIPAEAPGKLKNPYYDNN